MQILFNLKVQESKEFAYHNLSRSLLLPKNEVTKCVVSAGSVDFAVALRHCTVTCGLVDIKAKLADDLLHPPPLTFL